MESYIDAILRRQTAMSRVLMEENAELSSLLVLAEAAQTQAGPEAEAALPVPASEASSSEAQSAAAQVLAELTAMQESRSRIPLLRQTLSEQRQRQTMQALSVDPTRRTPENTSGGLTGSYQQTLVSSGIAGAPTERSMLEISRYFERDSRRYG